MHRLLLYYLYRSLWFICVSFVIFFVRYRIPLSRRMSPHRNAVSLGFSKPQDRPYEMHTGRSGTRIAWSGDHCHTYAAVRSPAGENGSSCVVSANAYAAHQGRRLRARVYERKHIKARFTWTLLARHKTRV